MAASIYYRYTDKRLPALPVDAPSSFMEVLKDVFGDFPIRISEAQAETIRGMRAGCGKTNREAFDKLLELIEGGREIEIWPEW